VWSSRNTNNKTEVKFYYKPFRENISQLRHLSKYLKHKIDNEIDRSDKSRDSRFYVKI